MEITRVLGRMNGLLEKKIEYLCSDTQQSGEQFRILNLSDAPENELMEYAYKLDDNDPRRNYIKLRFNGQIYTFASGEYEENAVSDDVFRSTGSVEPYLKIESIQGELEAETVMREFVESVNSSICTANCVTDAIQISWHDGFKSGSLVFLRDGR